MARAVLYAIEHPSREMWIGWTTIKAIVGQKLIPGILDRYLGRMAWNAQVTNLLPPTRKDNLAAPLPGDRGAHGPFGKEARSFSTQLWARTHRGALALGAALFVAVGAATIARIRARS
jgi:hypothetical protein